jgi:hypothetical protein
MEVAVRKGWNLVVSSHLPILEEYVDCGVDFHHLSCPPTDPRNVEFLDTWEDYSKMSPMGKTVNYVTGVLSYSFETILTQITHAISMAPDTDAVLLWEHDVLYPDGYADAMVDALSKGSDYAVYRDHQFLDYDGFFKPGMHFWYLSRYAARKDAIMNCFLSKIELGNYDILEPVLEGLDGGENSDSDSDNYRIVNGVPVIDVRHGGNASGQILVDKHCSRLPHWGGAGEYINIMMDDDYIKYVNSKPEVGYGLFISGQSFFL